MNAYQISIMMQKAKNVFNAMLFVFNVKDQEKECANNVKVNLLRIIKKFAPVNKVIS